MLIDAFVIGIIVAMFRGGMIKDLLNVKINAVWLIVLAFLIQYSSIFLKPSLLLASVIISYCFLILFCYNNRKYKSFYAILSGIAMNLLAMIVNKGRMPVDVQAAQQFAPELVPDLLAGVYGKHIAMSANTHLNYLGDIFYLHAPYPHPGVISLGDIVFSIGVFLFIQGVMVKRRSPIQGSVTHAAQS